MLIVGELINASRGDVRKAIEERDVSSIEQLAREQVAAGAAYVDVNAGVFVGREAESLAWLVTTVQGAVQAPCCIDSPDPQAIEAALRVHRGNAMINSVSLERSRLDTVLPLVTGTGHKVVALCMSDDGIPKTAEDRVRIADRLIDKLTKSGVPLGNIYVDPVVQPISTENGVGGEFLEAVQRIMVGFPGVHTICGLSNIGYGLPERKLLNQTFAVMSLARGLDALIANPLDWELLAGLIAADSLAGHDDYCGRFLTAYRKGRLRRV